MDYSEIKVAVILGASALQVPLIEKARNLGYYVVALDRDENAVGREEADEFRQISTLDELGVQSVVQETGAELLSTAATDAPMRVVASVCEKMGIASISLNTARLATNKALMMQKIAKSGVSLPKFTVLKSEADLENGYMQISKNGTRAVIIKPVNCSGSRGVIKVSPGDNIYKAFSYTHGVAGGSSVVISEFMSGPEVSVEVFVGDRGPEVIAITDKLTSGSPHFVELGHSQPSLLSDAIKSEINSLALEAVQALGINTGPAHVEIIVDRGIKPKIVEVGARIGGDFITSHLVPKTTGFDMLSATLISAAGKKVFVRKKEIGAAAVRFIISDPGRIIEIIKPNKQDYDDLKIDYQLDLKLNDVVENIASSNNRLGRVICFDETVELACQRCEDIISSTHIKVDN